MSLFRYSHNLLVRACGVALGHDVVDAMVRGRIGLPEITKVAALEFFTRQETTRITEFPWRIAEAVVRDAMQDLRTDGIFKFDAEDDDVIVSRMKILA